MSTKADYTPDQWQLLLDIPPMVGTAVMVAGKSGLGSLKEAFALARGVLGAKTGYEENELVQSLVQARLQDGERSQIEVLAENPYRGLEPAELAAAVTEKCIQVRQLLAEKASAEEAAGYQQWSIDVGEKVAHAAKEGGFLGIGGERVSQAERDVLDQVKAALA